MALSDGYIRGPFSAFSHMQTREGERETMVDSKALAQPTIEKDAHVLLLPYPAQGHLNPFLQFGKCLISRGVRVTLVLTAFIAKDIQAKVGPMRIETISDGYDDGGFASAESIDAYLTSFKRVGSKTLSDLVKRLEKSGQPVCCIVYDAFFPWALESGKQLGLSGFPMFTQSCSVCSLYYHVHHGNLKIPVVGDSVLLPSLPRLSISDLPLFISQPEVYPAYRAMVMDQFSNLEKADGVLINTFSELEDEVIKWMAGILPVKAVGPLVPACYLDKSEVKGRDYGLSLWAPAEDSIRWLDDKPVGSVVYVSFGSMSDIKAEQMAEIAGALVYGDAYFMWVVKEAVEDGLPSNIREELGDKGRLVRWCSQVEVLAHAAVGCFVTHCGWNSTLEAMWAGVPVVGFPQWTDQTTNAAWAERIWEVGLRVEPDEQGLVRREELRRCIGELMHGEGGKRARSNALRWRDSARRATDTGGTSETAIADFIRSICGAEEGVQCMPPATGSDRLTL